MSAFEDQRDDRRSRSAPRWTPPPPGCGERDSALPAFSASPWTYEGSGPPETSLLALLLLHRAVQRSRPRRWFAYGGAVLLLGLCHVVGRHRGPATARPELNATLRSRFQPVAVCDLHRATLALFVHRSGGPATPIRPAHPAAGPT